MYLFTNLRIKNHRLLIMKIVIIVVCIYFMVLLLAYLLQDKLLFFPHKINHDFDYNLTANDTELFLKTPENYGNKRFPFIRACPAHLVSCYRGDFIGCADKVQHAHYIYF